ncbi:MAG TPA: type I-E CRISPR-associated protein Cas7/Cse4/CasC [Rhodocyclaceae bacterium]|nr:type I-E CRISPR-associated protein Cas7/Cse4/CasC [Rhodocyclaceae bacterium]
MFLQIHTLTSYAAALLNRDDAGLAKRIPFGNAERMRVSSQCMKRHWTENLRSVIEQQHDGWKKFNTGWRTRNFFDRAVLPAVIDELQKHFLDPDECRAIAVAATWELACGCFTKSKKKKDIEKLLEAAKLDTPLEIPEAMKIDPDRGETIPRPKQPALFGKPEAQFFVREIEEIAKKVNETVKDEMAKETKSDTKDARRQKLIRGVRKGIRERVLLNWRERDKDGNTMVDALIRSEDTQPLYAGIEGALFGRFVTSDILTRSDAAVHVAHSFTVHPLTTEVDYFTVVDDLNRDEETGAAHAGDTELGAGLFYGYVVVDVPLLVSNLCGCDAKDWATQPKEMLTDARNVLTGLINAIATVSPGAKLGSTAPYARAACVLLESGRNQPRTLANAYLKAMKLTSDPMQQSVDALGDHLTGIDAMYGCNEKRFVASTQNMTKLASVTAAPLIDTVAAALDSVFGAG